MGQASRFRVGEPVFRFHDSDSDESSPSVVSIRSAGFAQVWGHDLRFFPLRKNHRQPLAQPASAPASAGLAFGTATLSHGCLSIYAPDTCIRWPSCHCDFSFKPSPHAMIFQSLEGILFGSQCCAWMLLCLAHHEWLQVVLCNKACHDYVRERASASAIRLPSDPPLQPSGSASSDTVLLP